MNDLDILFDTEEKVNETTSDGIDLDFETKAEEKEEIKEESAKEPEITEEVITDVKEDKVDNDDEVNLDELLADLDTEIDESNKALDKIEEISSGDNMGEISLLRDSLKRMEDQIKKLNNQNADLTFKNAELEAFGSDNADPKILILSRNMSKAIDGDERSKVKVVTTLKDMLYDLTGEDFDQTKTNKDVDILTASEMYNNETNPNLKTKQSNEIDGISI